MRRCVRAVRLVSGAGVLGLLTLSGCSSVDGTEGVSASGDYDTVVIAVPPWTGGEANAAVAALVLSTHLGVDVERVSLEQDDAWDALDEGSAHALLEDWHGSPAKEELYVEERESVVWAGDLGAVGHIGWFVPKHYADENPKALHWENLNDFADDFVTEESGGKGQLLQGDAGNTAYDQALIDQLGLDFQTVSAGSEQDQIEAIRQADRDGTPLLTYWWQPHWLNSETELVEVQLPRYYDGCHDDAERVSCGYPDTPLPKYLNADFSRAGGLAAEFLKELSWTTEDQNTVAQLIEGEGMTPDAAARKWLADHPDTLAQWLPLDG